MTSMRIASKACVAASSVLLIASAAHAANRWWDGTNTGGTGNGASDGGTATWDTAALNWDQGNGSARVAWVNGNNDTAIFAGTSGALSLGAAITVGGLQFDTASYTIQSNTLTFGVAGSIVANQNATISSVIAGSAAIAKSGSGTLTFSGTNTYTGGTTIGAGTLQAGGTRAFNNTSALSMTSGSGTLDLNGFHVAFSGATLSSATATIIDNASGSGTSTAALGTVTANIASFLKDGPTRRLAVTMSNNNGIPNLANGGNTFSGGLTLLHTASGTRLLMGSVVAGAYGSGPITIGQTPTDKAGILFNVGNQTLTNAIVFNTSLGTDLKGIRLDNSGNVFSGTITANQAPITFSAYNPGAATLSGKLTGPNGLTLDQANAAITITLSNAAANNDYQGSTTIAGSLGTLALGASNQIPNGASAGNVTNNGTFKLGGFSDTINGLSGTGVVDGVSGTPTLTVGDNNATSAFSGAIKNTAGSLALTKTGTGTLTLSGTNTYAGSTTIGSGTILLTDGLSTNMNQVVIVGTGGSLVLTNGARLFTTNGLNLGGTSGTIALYSNTVWNMRGQNANPGNLIGGTSNRFLVADGAIVTNTFGSGNVLLVFGNYCTIEIVNGGKAYWQNGSILFGQSVTRDNRILVGGSGAPAYMQSTNIVQIPQSGGAVANHGIVVSNGVWDAASVFLGRSLSTGNYINVFASGLINFSAQPLFIADNNAAVGNFLNVDGGVVTNVSGITIASAAGGRSNFVSVINGGRLWNRGALTVGAGAGAEYNAAYLGGAGGASTISNTTVTVGTAGSFNSITVTNAAWLTSGAATIGSGASNNTITIRENGVWNPAGHTIVIGSGAATGNALVVSGGLVTNLGQISVSSQNALYLDGGTLAAGANGSLLGGAGGAFIRSGGATIDTLGLAVTNGLVLQQDSGSTGGGLTKRGVGTLTLVGASTYSGPTIVSAGLLRVNGSTSTGAVTVASGGTLGGTGTLGGAVTVHGAVAPGSDGIGRLTTSGSVTWNAAVAWPYDLAASSSGDRLHINGSFTKGTGSGWTFDLMTNGVSGVYTLVTWSAGTTFAAGDFSVTNVPPDLSYVLAIVGNELRLTLAAIGSLTWDAVSGNLIVNEGSGTWQSGIGNWFNGVNHDQVWSDGRAATFGGGAAGAAGTIALGGNIAAGLITFTNTFAGTYTVDLATSTLTLNNHISASQSATLTNGTLSMGGGVKIFTTESGAHLTIASKITSGQSLWKSGFGYLSLNNTNNDFAGELYSQNAGFVSVSSIKDGGVPSAAGAGTNLNIAFNGGFAYSGSGDSSDRLLVLSGSGGKSLYADGTGALVLTGPVTNTSTAATTLYLLGAHAGTNEVGGVLADSASGALSIEKSQNGLWVLSGTNTFTGPIQTMNGGTLRIGGSGQLGAGNYTNSITLNLSSTFDYSSSANQILGGLLSGTGHVLKNGVSTLILTGANTYSGATTISGGTLQLGSGGTGGALSTDSAISIGSGATFAVNQSDTVTQGTDFSGAALTGAGGFAKAGSGTTVLNAANTYGGNTTIGAGTLIIGGNGSLGLGHYGGAIANSGDFLFSSSSNQTLSGVVSGSGTITKTNSSTLTLTAYNTFTGGLNIHGGVLVATNSIGTGSGTTTVSGVGSVLRIRNTNVLGGNHNLEYLRTLAATNGGVILVSEGLNRAGNLKLYGSTLTADVSVANYGSLYFGSVAGQNATITVGGSAASTIGGSGNLTLGSNTVFNVSDVTADANADLTVNTPLDNIHPSIAQMSGLTKSGAGTMVLSAANTYSNATEISAGTLLVNGAHSASSGYTVYPGATLGGAGAITAPVIVSGVVSPGSANSATGTLNVVGNVTWNGGSSASSATDWRFQLGPQATSDVLNITGNFTKGSGSAFRFDFGGTTNVGTFKLVDWSGSTDFAETDFSYANLGGSQSVAFQFNGSQLEVLLIADCVSPPVVTLGHGPALCYVGGGTISTNIGYSGAAGSPDKYSIDYSDAANATGFVDVGVTVLGASPVPLSVPGFAAAGVYTGTLYVIRSSTGCRGGTNFTVTVHALPATPGAITGSGSACTNENGVSYSIADVSGATNYIWTVPANGTIAGGQGTTSITVNWGAAGSGDVSVSAQGSCGTSANQSKIVTVHAGVPDAPVANPASGVTLTSFVANWASVASASGYRLDVASTVDFQGGTYVLSNHTTAATSHALSGLNSGATYYYRVRAYHGCGASTNSAVITVLTPVVLAGWNMNGLTGYGASPMTPTESYTDVIAGGLTRGADVGLDGTAEARGWGGTGWDSVNAAIAAALGDSAYHTIQAKSGRNVSYYSISKLDYRRDSVNGPTTGTLQFSMDGSTYTDITTISYMVGAAGNSVSPIDLSSVAALQNVPSSTTVTFRIVNHGALSALEPWYIYDKDNSSANDYQIQGSICSNPIAYMVSGGGTFCSPGFIDTTITLGGSENGVTYQLYKDGVAEGSPVAGTGGALSFGAHSEAASYGVVATRNSGGCSSPMVGTSIAVETTPAAPISLAALTNAASVALSWTAPGGAVTGYRIYRRLTSGAYGPALATNTGSGSVTFVDTTPNNGVSYAYGIRALNVVCESDFSNEVVVDMPVDDCTGGVAPTLTPRADTHVLVGGSLDISVTASDSSGSCPSPTNSISELPAPGVTITHTPGAGSWTTRIQWTPDLSQVGTYPVTIIATDSEGLTTSRNFIIYVGLQGEPVSGGVPNSQTNWSVAITHLIVPSSGNATVVWTSVDGVQYDVYSSALPIDGGASWIKQGSTVEADGNLATASVVAAGSMRFYQVVPQGQPTLNRGVWGIVRPSIPSSMHLMSPPILGDRSLADSGAFGQALAAVVPEGAQVHIATDGTPTWQTLEKVGGVWRTDPGGVQYTTPLNAGQAFYLQGASGAAPTFSGPVGNAGTQSVSLAVGYNLLGVSEGKGLAAGTAFGAAAMNPDPVGNNDYDQADQLWIQHSNGAWRWLVRLSNGTWYDMTTMGTTSVTLMPGEAYYYIRTNSSSTVSF